MSGQLWFMLGVGVLAGAGLERLILWRKLRREYERGCEDGYNECDEERDQWEREHTEPVYEPVTFAPEPVLVGHTIYPELAALAALDVPEPETAGVKERAEPGRGLGHPSPYTGPLTPAQRRRDKHKQRGPWAPGDLPDPPTDVGAWWQAELDALLVDGQSEWLTRNLAAVA